MVSAGRHRHDPGVVCLRHFGFDVSSMSAMVPAMSRSLRLACVVAALTIPSGVGAQQSKPPEQAPGTAPQSRPDVPKPDVPKKDNDPKAVPKGADPKGAVPGPKSGRQVKGPETKGPEKKGPPPIAVLQPRTPAEREKALSDLYAHLATADSDTAAKTIAQSIERLWQASGSDTVHLLMERAQIASQGKKPELALKLLDAAVELAPDYAEGWSKRAHHHFAENRFEQAIGDLRRVLALDPNHYKALEGVAQILKEIGQKKGALAAVKKLMEVHPFAEGAKQMHDELSREVEGQSL
jgi:Tetratricopeptide repeat